MKAYGKLYGSCFGKHCFAWLPGFLALIFVSVCAVCMLTGCGGEPQVMNVPVLFDERYCVMRPDVADQTEVDAAVKLAGKINETFGRKPTLTSDWVNRGETVPETAYEILIGRTNRPETAEAAELLASAASRGLDFCILYRNQRIVLFGMTPEATLSAVDYFLENCVDAEKNQFLLPEEALLIEGDYPIPSFTLDGKSVGEYVLVYNKKDPAAAECAASVRDTVFRQTGYTVADADGEGEAASRITVAVDNSVDTGYIRRSDDGVIIVGRNEEYLHSMTDAFLQLLKGENEAVELSLEHEIAYTAPNAGFSPGTPITTQKEYRERMDRLSSLSSCIADDEVQREIDLLTDGLRQIILNNNDPVSVNGKVYYVSPDGDDGNDGLSEKTAWRTLEKVNAFRYSAGDAVLLKRGCMWRGSIDAQNGVTYSAYGTGEKPRIYAAYDGMTVGEWVKTDIENVWKLDVAFEDIDIGLLVMNEDTYAVKHSSMDALRKQGDFFYRNEWCSPDDFDNKVYFYSEKNPTELYRSIDVSQKNGVINVDYAGHDITFDNLDCRYGQGHFFGNNFKNITTRYCVFFWQGGQYYRQDNLQGYGGGGGAWQNATNLVYDHCLFYQQYDCCLTLQFSTSEAGSECVYSGYTVTDCLLDSSEWGFEYYISVPETYQNHFENLYMAYNIFRKGGDSNFFGTKHEDSSYIKAWPDYFYNRSENSLIEKNLFDRPYRKALTMYARNKELDYSIEDIFDMRSNIYFCRRDQIFASINKTDYPFNEASRIALQEIGFEDGAVFLYQAD